jgi:topoisomerase-4 subunit B
MAYNATDITSPEALDHVRLRPGMYIGRTGDGKSPEDGIYILIKEVIDNGIDEFLMGEGTEIHITTDQSKSVTVRDFGRGIPLAKMMDCASRMLTGAKFGSKAFHKSVGLHGVGIKAVNALSESFIIESYRDKRMKRAEFSQGKLVKEYRTKATKEKNGTWVSFTPDPEIFEGYAFESKFIERMLRNYAYLNRNLALVWNGAKFISEEGLLDLLEEHVGEQKAYPIFHWSDDNLEVAITHGPQSGDDYFSYVNGQHTIHGGTHEQVFREIYMRTLRDFYQKSYDAADLRSGLVAALSLRISEPVFESQTKTKLGSSHMEPKGETLRQYLGRTFQPQLDKFLHKNSDIAEIILKKILSAERNRKELNGVKKVAKERAKQAKILNKKLTDCVVHYNTKHAKRADTMLFLTEGDSASGPMIAVREPQTQAVFSLRGKPLNTFGLSKKVVYENEEFYLIQDALNLEDGMEGLRYNKVILATDADVDGMHIRLLMVTFFMQFFPDLVKRGHLYVLQTPLFRVRNKKKTTYCYSDKERLKAIKALGPNPEITRFKGLGEISPEEFAQFIGEGIRLDPITVDAATPVQSLMGYFMGKNTPERQEFILENLQIEGDIPTTDSVQLTATPPPKVKPKVKCAQKAPSKPAPAPKSSLSGKPLSKVSL